MAKYSGRRQFIGVGKEATRGTAVTPTYWVPVTDFTFKNMVTKVQVTPGIGTLEGNEQSHVLTKWAEGDVSGEVRDASFGLFLLSLFGGSSVTGPADQAYTHTFVLENTNQHQSLTFVVKDPNTTKGYRLVVLSSLELTQEMDSTLNYTATFMGLTSVGADETESYTAEQKFTKRHVAFKVAGSLGELSSASNVSLKSATITLNSNVVVDDVLGTAEPEDFLNTTFTCEGSITLNYEDDTWMEYMRQNTYKALSLKWENTEETIGTGSTNPSIEFKMPKVDWHDWEPNMALDEIVSQTAQFTANRDLENGEDTVKVYVVNGTASY